MMRPVRWEVVCGEYGAEVAVDTVDQTVTITQDGNFIALSATDLEPLFAALWAAEAVAKEAGSDD